MADDKRKVQLESAFDATGVRQGTDQAKQALQDLARTAQTSGEAAGAGVRKIGEGADDTAAKVDRGTKSIINSIQRVSAQMTAGEKNSAAYFEALANQRGASLPTLKPYLDDLKKAEEAQRKAAGTLSLVGVSAGQTSQAIRQLPAQLTDVATQLAGGQSPFLVLLQQGGQVKDSFGGIGNASKVLLSYVTPLRLALGGAAAAALAVGLAYSQGAEEGKAFERALILSGNAAGTTRDQLSGMAAAIGKSVGTQGQAADALAQLAATGQVAAGTISLAAEAAVRLERVGVQSVGKTAAAFAELGKDPLQASIKLNESVNYLTLSVLKQIKTLQDQGQMAQAAKVAQEAWGNAGIDIAKRLEANLGPLERAWLGVATAAGKAWNAMVGIGRPATIEDKLAEAGAKVERLRANTTRRGSERTGLNENTGRLQAALDEQAALQETQRTMRKVAELEAQRTAATRAGVDFEKLREQSLTKQERMQLEIKKARELAETSGAKPQELEKVLAGIREKYKETGKEIFNTQLAALKSSQGLFDEITRQSLEALNSEAARGLITQRELIEGRTALEQQAAERRAGILRDELDLANRTKGAEKERIELAFKLGTVALQTVGIQEAGQQRLLELTYKQAQAAKAVVAAQREEDRSDIIAALVREEAARTQGYMAVLQYSRGIDESIERTQLETQLIGQTEQVRRVAIEHLQIELELRRQIEAINANSGFDQAQRDREITRARAAAARASLNAEQKVALEEWTKTSEQIGQSLTDALMQGGKSAWEYIKGLFRSTVLRPIIQAVAAPLTSALASGANAMNGGAGGVGGGGGDLITGTVNLYSAGQRLYDGFASGFASVGTSVANAYGTAVANASGTGIDGLLATNNAFGTAGGTGGTGTALGGAASYAAGAAAGIYSGRAISGGYSAIGGQTGNSAVNVGTLIGSYWGPWGAAIGGALGGAFNRAFGRKAPEVESQILRGTFASGDFTGDAVTNVVQKGGLFRSDKRTQTVESVTGDLDKALDAGATQIRDLARKYGDALGLPASALAGISKSISVSIGNDAEANQKAITEALNQYADALIGSFANDVEPLRRAGETTAQVIERVGGNLLQVNDLFRTLGLTLLETSIAGGTAAQALSDGFGGLNQLGQAAGQYYAAYYTEAERAAMATTAITETLARVGVVMPGTREEFRKIVEAQDLTTESGRAAFTALLQVNDAFAQLTPAVAEAGDALTQTAIAMSKELGNAIDQTIDKFLTSSQRTARSYSTIAGNLAGAGITVDVSTLVGATKAQILDFAQAFVLAADNSDAAKLAVVQAAGALADLKDQAAAASAALDQQLQQVIEGNIDKFLTPRQRLDRQVSGISSSLAGVGVNFSPEQLLGASRQTILDFAQAFVLAADNSTEAKIAVVDAAGSLVDLSSALTQLQIDDFLTGLRVSAADLMSAYHELRPEADNLVDAWRNTKTQMVSLRDALDELAGTAAVSAIDQLRAAVAQRNALQGVITGNTNRAFDLRVGQGGQGALDLLRSREAELWRQFASTNSPEVAQAITDITLQRIDLEGQLQAQANVDQLDALRQQIIAAERLRDVAAEMGGFILQLKAGDLSNLSATGRLAAQRSLFNDSLATGVDVQGNAQALLRAAQQTYGGSTAQYSAIFDDVTANLARLGMSGAGATATISDAQRQIDALTNVSNTAEQQAAALGELNASFSVNLGNLNTVVDQQLQVQRDTLIAMQETVLNQETQILQAGEAYQRMVTALESMADALVTTPIDRALTESNA